MERTQLNAQSATVAILLLTLVSGCESPVAYHLKHYHSPFRAIAESNKTYYHSPHTGRVIPKDPCGKYCEPGCFGFEPTCWTPWPEECVGNCPMNEVVEVIEPASEVPEPTPAIPEPIMDAIESDIDGLEPTPASPSDLGSIRPSPPATVLESDLPSAPNLPPRTPPRVPAPDVAPSIPVDEESSIPSPSDASRKIEGIRKIEEPDRTSRRTIIEAPQPSPKRPLINRRAGRSVLPLPTGVFQEVSGARLPADKVRPQRVRNAHTASTRRLTDIRPVAAWPTAEADRREDQSPVPRRLKTKRLPEIEAAALTPKAPTKRVKQQRTTVSEARPTEKQSGRQQASTAAAEIRFVRKASPHTKRLTAVAQGDHTIVRFR